MDSSRTDDAPLNQNGFKSWLSSFGNRAVPPNRTDAPLPPLPPESIFGQPLHHVLKCSSVPIRLAEVNEEPYIWGYIPAIVAKTGLYLKQHGLNVEGIFRVGGSEKRVRELQDIFNAPNVCSTRWAHNQYGKVVDWLPYTVHDAAGLLRRYLNQMPEPIIPKSMSRKFCRVMTKRDLEDGAKIEQYRRLITSIPQANQYLLLYILDLLAVVQHNSNTNKMTAQNLAIVFQPSILSHPHLNSKDEHLAAVEVIEFLIEHQDNFVLALSKPPPQDVPPEELTTRIPAEIEDYVIIPSDSDEEVAEYQVHLGGGSLLANTQTTSHPFFNKLEWKKRSERLSITPTEEEPKPLNLFSGSNGVPSQRPGHVSPLFTTFFSRARSSSQTEGVVDDHRPSSASDSSGNHQSRTSKSTRRPSIRVNHTFSSVKPERSVSSNEADREHKLSYISFDSPARSDGCLAAKSSGSSDNTDSAVLQNYTRHSSRRPPIRKSQSARHTKPHQWSSSPSGDAAHLLVSPRATDRPLSPASSLDLLRPASPISISAMKSESLSHSSRIHVSEPVASSSALEGAPVQTCSSSTPASQGFYSQNTLRSVPPHAPILPEKSLDSATRPNTTTDLMGTSEDTCLGKKGDDLNSKSAAVVLTISASTSLP